VSLEPGAFLPLRPGWASTRAEPRCTRLIRKDAPLLPNLHLGTISLVGDVLTGLLLGVGFALPWICGIVLLCRRAGWRLLWSEPGGEFPTQAARLRSFGGG
jgi:hypothetical protein